MGAHGGVPPRPVPVGELDAGCRLDIRTVYDALTAQRKTYVRNACSKITSAGCSSAGGGTKESIGRACLGWLTRGAPFFPCSGGLDRRAPPGREPARTGGDRGSSSRHRLGYSRLDRLVPSVCCCEVRATSSQIRSPSQLLTRMCMALCGPRTGTGVCSRTTPTGLS